MANITITIPDNVINEVVDAFATKYDYDTMVARGIFVGNKAAFAKKKVADYIKAIYIEDKDRISSTTRSAQAEVIRQQELAALEQVIIN